MSYLHITEFLNWEEGAILNFLVIQEEIDFEISIPKSTQEFFSTNMDIAIEYAAAAYCGQRISESCKEFEYEEVGPKNHSSISFYAKEVNLEMLAEVLYDVSFGYGSDDSDGEFMFHDAVEGFIDDVRKKKLRPVCPYLFDMYKEFSKKH